MIVIATAGDDPAVLRAARILTDQGFRAVRWAAEATPPQLLLAALSQSDVTIPAIRSAAVSHIPLLAIGPPDQVARLGVSHDAVDSTTETFEPDDVIRRAHSLLARRGYLHLLTARFDDQSKLLTQTSETEWVRCRTGIVGLIRLETPESGERLRHLLATAIAGAHSALDELPPEALTSNDLWNLLLLVSLPWNQAEAAGDSRLMGVLTELEHDVTGSRKVCLWRGVSPLSHISGFAAAESSWVPSSSNPLREELQKLAKDAIEYDALASIFKRRLLESDVEGIIEALRRSK